MAKKRIISGKASLSPARFVAEESRYLMKTYRRPPVVFTHGRGCRLYDSQGRAYLDFLAGIAVNALGYAHPRMVRVIRREAGRATHVSNLFHNPYQAPLARKLAEWSGLDRVFFSNSGSEAIEGALKLARAYAHAKADHPAARGKTRILALENSFHGRTLGALSITHTAKYREPFAPLVPGVEFVRFNDVADLEAKFDDTVCAIVIEPIQGEGGVSSSARNFWNVRAPLAIRSRRRADRRRNSVRSGPHRARVRLPEIRRRCRISSRLRSRWPVACRSGAFIASEKFASALSPGCTVPRFGGGPLVCAAALEFLTVVEDENLLANVRARGAELRAGLEKLAARFDFIREIRGEGLILGIDLAVEGAPIRGRSPSRTAC